MLFSQNLTPKQEFVQKCNPKSDQILENVSMFENGCF